MTILIVILAVLIFIGLLFEVSRNRPIDSGKLEREISIWCEVVYQRGYNDLKAGKPQEIWDVSALAKSAPERSLSNGLKQVYQEGYRDASNNLPSKAEQIRQNRKEQLLILKEMRATIGDMQTALANARSSLTL